MLYFIFLVLLIPFTILLYETDEEKPFCARMCRAFIYVIFFIIAATILSVVAYSKMKEAKMSKIIIKSY